MYEGIYQDEPIPKRAHAQSADGKHAGASRANTGYRPAPRTPMNGSRADAREAIARIMADERFLSSEYINSRRREQDEERMRGIWTGPHDESLIDLGVPASINTHPRASEPAPKQTMASQMPQGYREMLALSRWEASADGRGGRWLSEAELFYRQGKLIEDLEDDYPHQGSFKSYFPTYNAMSDRQLRSYVTWRSAVRRGVIEEAPLSFAYVYLYELINGIGISSPEDGFQKLETFWQAYREFAPEIDRFASVWLQDYVVYHGLPAQLLDSYKTLSFDRALLALRKADADVHQLTEATHVTPGNDTASGKAARPRRKGDESALPLPTYTALETELFQAIDGLSTYRLSGSKLYKEHAEALRHVACAVYVRMSEYHQKNRKGSLLESWFGEEVTLPYTMFGSAVFFAPQRHADCVYELDEIHRYRCLRGYWTCERFHGGRAKSPKLGAMMHEVDRTLREALVFDHPLKKTSKIPKYLRAFIDREVAAWLTWHAAHAPRRIAIDLSQLDGIRSAASLTRESLLIDEEREGGQTSPLLDVLAGVEDTEEALQDTITEAEELQMPTAAATHAATELQGTSPTKVYATTARPETPSIEAPETEGPLSNAQVTYLQALIFQDAPARKAAIDAIGCSEDMLVDAINEACFDLIGDTVIEYGADGPELIEDYRDDVEGFIRHD